MEHNKITSQTTCRVQTGNQHIQGVHECVNVCVHVCLCVPKQGGWGEKRQRMRRAWLVITGRVVKRKLKKTYRWEGKKKIHGIGEHEELRMTKERERREK